MRWQVAGVTLGALLLLCAFMARAGTVELSKVQVAGKGVADAGAAAAVKASGTISGAAGIVAPAGAYFQCGTYEETLAAESVEAHKGRLAYHAARGVKSGLLSLSVSVASGKFTLKAKVIVGDLSTPVPFTLDVGGARTTGLLTLSGSGKSRAWKAADGLGAVLRGRVLGVTYEGASPVLTPVSGTTFVRDDGEEVVGVVDTDDPKTDLDGRFAIEVTSPGDAALRGFDAAQVLGEAAGRTRPGRAVCTPGKDGQWTMATFVQARSSTTADLSPGSSTDLDVPAETGIRGGTLHVPAGSVASPVDDVSFTPYTMPVELPGALPEGYQPVAGAEVTAPAPSSFEPGAQVTVELQRPGWLSAASLAAADIRLLEWDGIEWTVRSGKGVYVLASDRIEPDPDDPATLSSTSPVVYAVVTAPEDQRRLRGRVVDGDGNPIPQAVALTRAGGAMSDENGEFEVQAVSLEDTDLEVVQAVGLGSSTAKVVSASDLATQTVDVPLAAEEQLQFQVGLVSGTVYETDGETPVPDATVSLRVSGSVTGLQHDEAGTPGNFSDDVFSVRDLQSIGVTQYEWALFLPGEIAPFVSTDSTTASAQPSLLLLEAQGAGKTLNEGAYTVRVTYDVPVLGTFSVWGGFRVSYEGIVITISDVQLPANYETAAAVTATTNAQGVYSILYRAALGVPLEAKATKTSIGNSPWRTFQHATTATRDLTLDATATVRPQGWVTLAPPARFTFAGCAAAVLGGRLYVAGGDDGSGISKHLDVYDPGADGWTTKASMNRVRADHGLAATGGEVYVMGGSDSVGASIAFVEAYDPVLDQWSTKASMASPRQQAMFGVVGGKIYACGGFSTGTLDTCEVYDPQLNSWSPTTPMSAPRRFGGAAVVDGILYVFGGLASPGIVGTVEAYDPSTSVWTTKAPMSIARYGMAFGVVDGEIHVAGGNTGEQGVADMEIYDPVSNTWRTGLSMPAPRYWAASAVLNGVLHVLGGAGDPVPRHLAYGPP